MRKSFILLEIAPLNLVINCCEAVGIRIKGSAKKEHH